MGVSTLVADLQQTDGAAMMQHSMRRPEPLPPALQSSSWCLSRPGHSTTGPARGATPAAAASRSTWGPRAMAAAGATGRRTPRPSTWSPRSPGRASTSEPGAGAAVEPASPGVGSLRRQAGRPLTRLGRAALARHRATRDPLCARHRGSPYGQAPVHPALRHGGVHAGGGPRERSALLRARGRLPLRRRSAQWPRRVALSHLGPRAQPRSRGRGTDRRRPPGHAGRHHRVRHLRERNSGGRQTNAIYGVDRQGRLRWRQPERGSFANPFIAAPALSPDGSRVYLVTQLRSPRHPASVFAIEPERGHIQWRLPLGDVGGEDLAVGIDGTLYVAGLTDPGRRPGRRCSPCATREIARASPRKRSRTHGPRSEWASGIALREMDGRVTEVYVSTTRSRELGEDGVLMRLDPATGQLRGASTWRAPRPPDGAGSRT